MELNLHTVHVVNMSRFVCFPIPLHNDAIYVHFGDCVERENVPDLTKLCSMIDIFISMDKYVEFIQLICMLIELAV